MSAFRSHSPTLESSNWVRRWVPLIPAGSTALDLAAGSGRHTRLLAAHGCRVLAFDRDSAAMDAVRAEYGVETLVADLEAETWPLEHRVFEAIVVTNYLHRPAWPRLLANLAPGGVLIYETFMEGNARFGKPSNPDFLLRPGELLRLALEMGKGMQVVAFEQGIVEDRAAIQRICAVAGEAPQALY